MAYEGECFYSKLTPAQIERLAKLAEECGEVCQVVGKILVRGYDNRNPNKPESDTNREHLEKEIGGLGAVVELMRRAGDFDMEKADAAYHAKLGMIHQYLYHQG